MASCDSELRFHPHEGICSANTIGFLPTKLCPQIEGAFIQGMGLYTIEELKYSPEGVLYSRGPDDYKIPTVTEIPEEFNVTLVHSQNPIAIYSSKVRVDNLCIRWERTSQWVLNKKIPQPGGLKRFVSLKSPVRYLQTWFLGSYFL